MRNGYSGKTGLQKALDYSEHLLKKDLDAADFKVLN
jgi:hypothetical protein